MFDKVLIANRGEIACRIIRTCRKMGIKTVAVYSEEDTHALHVQQADEAHLLGAAIPKESYLNISRIIEVAQIAKVDAIHPGYGFLSQNPNFAKACNKAKITFIGPTHQVMKRMGDKVRARKLAQKAGLPVLAGSDAEVKDNVAAQSAAANGFPLMVKAANGGGGIGIQVVRSPKELKGVMARARALARKAFGSKRLYFEKFLEGASHIEIQIVADNHGNVLHLFERDCSVQRRNQKVVEETPSTKLTSEQRQSLFDYSLALARHIQYTNMGTVEFLVSRNGEIYFLEMNTRLQVEHGITELITGLDMVEMQVRIAYGEKLQLRQEEIKLHGHAIEARINAEDPDTFLPSAGVIDHINEPEGDHVRFDSALFPGYQVSTYYDSLLSKLMVWGKTRKQAITRLRNSLDDIQISGLKTNLPTLQTIISHKKFTKGEYHTGLLEQIAREATQKFEMLIPSLSHNGDTKGEKSRVAEIAVTLLLSMDKLTSDSDSQEQVEHTINPWKIAGRQVQLHTNIHGQSNWQ